jgi:hypothetical protein
MPPSTEQQLAALLREAGKAHHRAFAPTNGDDPAWPRWYAEYLTPHFQRLTGNPVDVERLAADLVAVDQDQRREAAAEPWAEYYASWFLRRRPRRMAQPSRVRSLLPALLVGTATGALLLGVGGRLVMRAFALATGRPSGFSVGGTFSVILSGAIAGCVGGVLLFVAARFVPPRLQFRGLLFGLLCYALATPGFRPPQLLVFALFAPTFLAYGVATVILHERFTRSERRRP